MVIFQTNIGKGRLEEPKCPAVSAEDTARSENAFPWFNCVVQ